MLPLIVHQVNRMKDLHRLMRVQCGNDLRDNVEIPVNEFAESSAVVHCSTSGPSPDKKLEAWNTKGVLHINHEQRNPEFVGRCRFEVVNSRPGLSLLCPLLIRNAEDLIGDTREMRRNWK